MRGRAVNSGPAPDHRPGKADGSMPQHDRAFLLTCENTRFVQFTCPATGIGELFHVPNDIQTTAKAIVGAPGMDAS